MTRNRVQVSHEESVGLEQCSALFEKCTFQILTGTSAILTTILVLYSSHSTQCPNSASKRSQLLIPNHLQFLSHPNIDAVESETQSIVKPFKPGGYCMYCTIKLIIKIFYLLPQRECTVRVLLEYRSQKKQQ